MYNYHMYIERYGAVWALAVWFKKPRIQQYKIRCLS